MAKISESEFEALELIVLQRMRGDFLSRRDHRFSTHVIRSRYEVEDDDTASRLFERIKRMHAVDEKPNPMGVRTGEMGRDKYYYEISPSIIDIVAAREADIAAKNEPVDRVAAVEKWARSSAIVWWLIVAIVVATVVMACVNQAFELYKNATPLFNG